MNALSNASTFIVGGGKVGALMRERNWSKSPLGPPDGWPQSLRSVVGLLLNSKFPMFVAWGDELGFLYNDAYAEILGAKHPAALGSRFYDIWSEIWSEISPLIDAAMAGEASYRENLPLLMNRKGFDEQTWFTFSYSPVRDESGRVAGMFCAVAETTAQVLNERALRASEARYRALFESIDEGFCVLEYLPGGDGRAADFRYLEANPALVPQSRIDGVVGRTIREMLPGEAGAWIDIFEGVLKSGEPLRFERPLAATGRLLELFAFRVESFGHQQVAVLFEDVTERRRAEQAMLRLNDELEQRVAAALAERKLLADIVEGTDISVVVADLDYRWLAVNAAAAKEFERIYGVRPELGRSMLEQLAGQPEQQAALGQLWGRAFSGEAFTTIDAFGDPQRDRPYYEIRFNPLRDETGTQIGAYAFVNDVTERLQNEARLVEAEDTLRQTQKIEAIGQLTGGVAHDFNNLLTPIVGALDLLRRRVNGDERAHRMTVGALQAAERARILVQRLLAFARRQHLQPRAVDVCDLVKGIATLLSRSLGPRIELVLDIAVDSGSALVDPNQLELALLNLAVNARDAMGEEGTLTIAVRREPLPAFGKRRAAEYMRVSVSDTGIGMDEETLRRAVEPFFTTKEIGRGTGLGLSSVQGLAEQSGGEFRLTSRPGQGTTASLWLPVAEQPAGELAAVATGDFVVPRAHDTPVLLVDDEELVRLGTADMLTEAGYRVTEAGSAYQALDLLKKGIEADILVTDYAMPGMTGTQLAREARTLRPGLLVLMITGYAALSDHDAGTIARLAKPFRQSDLAAAVAELLGGRTRHAQADR